MIDFNAAEFMLSAPGLKECPPDFGAEIAFAGRSNAGKSSTINAITRRKALARTSKTPGRTQALNFFSLQEDLRLVDLPGYGFAKVPEAMRKAWMQRIDAYLRDRSSLRGLVLVMDMRHPLKDFEVQMLDWCDQAGLRVHVLLNKADKLKRGEAARTLLEVQRALGNDGMHSVQAFSALRGLGLDEARATISEILAPDLDTSP